ncbi:MAG: hydroxylamine reductase [Candidatus Sumerlaeaceae bacterium]|nr:hydroxylamine reductase [Candidatus Sumerlaeaceae bacterium]
MNLTNSSISSMHCDQCEQTFRGQACVSMGVCGKNPDVESLQKILLYGLKGMASYKAHARRLGKTDPEVESFIEEALFATVTNVNFDEESMLELVLECGRMNLKTMQMLNDGHVEVLGKPSPTTVREGLEAGPGILVTGHDMVDLKDLLEQTAGKGINVYTHGEMLPAHMYPKLREFPHLKGHFGGAWQKQRDEFEAFGGAILATTNCVLIPRETNTYLPNFFTTRVTAVPGATRLTTNDFSAVIKRALEIGSLKPTPITTSTIGFHYTVLLDVADKIVEAVKAGDLKHFFVIGGCDGAEPGRNYYADYAANTPPESIVLTLGCGKYRIRNQEYGTIKLGGLEVPRLLDMGQCNDAYGAVQVALALAKAFECGVNDLPLSLVISWFEQKAVAVLLTLLHLGVKNIRLGPALPAFITPNVLAILHEKYGLSPIGTDAVADVEAALARN